MASARRKKWRIGRWIVASLPRAGLSITLGTPGRRLTIDQRGLALRLGRPGGGVAISWRRSWRRLWRTLREQRSGIHRKGRRGRKAI